MCQWFWDFFFFPNDLFMLILSVFINKINMVYIVVGDFFSSSHNIYHCIAKAKTDNKSLTYILKKKEKKKEKLPDVGLVACQDYTTVGGNPAACVGKSMAYR